MSDVQSNTQLEQSINSLKKQADRLGISYKSNTSMATLQKAVKDKLEEPMGESTEQESTSTVGITKGKTIEDHYSDAMKLVRVIITPMESNKASNLEYEMVCAGNSVVGTVKRVITFGEPWHVEQILLNALKEKKFQMFTSKKNSRGVVITQAKLVNAYNIAELPPLSDSELDALADRQIRTRSLDDDE